MREPRMKEFLLKHNFMVVKEDIERAKETRLYKGQDHPDLATSLNNLGNVLQALGRLEEALGFYRKALAMTERLYKGQNHPHLASFLNNLGNVLQALGRLEEALGFYRKALAMTERLYKGQNHPHLASFLNNLGNVLQALGRLEEALGFFRQALAMTERLYKGQDHPDLATSLNNLGYVLDSLGRLEEALGFYRKALAMTERLYKGQDHPDLATSLDNMGAVLNSLGRLEEALGFFRQALAMTERLYKGQDHPDLATSLNSMGAVLASLGRLEEALGFYRKALAMRERLYKSQDHPHLATSLNNMGGMLQALCRSEEALGFFRKALAMTERLYKGQDHPDLASSLNNLGGVLVSLGRLEEALGFFRKALAMFERLYKGQDHPHLATSLNSMGGVLVSLGRLEEALGFCRQAWQINQRLYSSYAMAGSTWHKRELWQKLLAPCQSLALTTLSSLTNPNPNATDIHAAYAGVVFNKSIIQRILMAEKHVLRHSQEPELAQLVQQYQTTVQALANLVYAPIPAGQEQKLRAQSQQLNRRKLELEEKISQKSSRLAAWIKITPLDADAIHKCLPPQTVLLEWVKFYHYKQKAYWYACFVVTADAIKFVPLGNAENLEQPVQALLDKVKSDIRRFCELEKSGQSQAAGAWLSQEEPKIWQQGLAVRNILLTAVKPYLRNTIKILIAPDGILHLLPWAMLPIRDKYGKRRYLVERFSFGYCCSGETLLKKTVVLPAEPSFYGIACDFPEEIEVCSKWFRHVYPHSKIVQEKAASEVFFKQQAVQGNWLHISAHAFFEQAKTNQPPPDYQTVVKAMHGLLADKLLSESLNPLLLSCILLKKQPPEDGRLTAEEIALLDFPCTTCAVLSCCGTGLGKVEQALGLGGLKWAFKNAGVQNTVLTLWDMIAGSTSQFMSFFYAYALSARMPVDQALNHVQHKFLRQTTMRHPALWAGFIVNGLPSR